MDLIDKQKKRFESAISICVLVVLVLIGAGILIKQHDFDMGRFGLDIITATKSLEPDGLPGKTEDSKSDMSSRLSALAPAGFEPLSKAAVYTSETLYEKINGKAPFYHDAGFEKLLTQRFISKENTDLWMELSAYDMGTAKNAFSVYSVQRRAEAEIVSYLDPVFGYKTGNALYFIKGPYYVELVGSAESDELLGAMVEISQKFDDVLVIDRTGVIAGLDLLPSENMVQGSIKLYLNNVFGFEGLSDTFTARYTVDDEEITAFISKRADKQEATSVFDSYCTFLIDNGGEIEEARDGELKYKVIDFYGVIEIVFATGPFAGGIHEAEDQESAGKAAAVLINKITKGGGQ